MTVAVFNKGVFIDFWLNEPSEKGWIERTIAAKSWLRQDVQVYVYEYSRNGSELLSFDSEKNLQKLQSEVIQVDGVDQTVYSVEQTYNKIPLFLNGEMV